MKNQCKRSPYFGVLAVILVFSCAVMIREVWAREQNKKPRGAMPANVTGVPMATLSNINNISAWYNANGEQERIPGSGNSGLTFPRGTATAIYSAGLIWGGKFNDGRTPITRTNGQSYQNGTKPGAILGIRTGIAEDPNAPDVRIWRIRRDYATADLRLDAAEFFGIPPGIVTQAHIDSVRNQYARDWVEWPWWKGAPFYDMNLNGVKEPGEDPGIASADQVLWYVCNDIGVAQPWACPESGIEEQVTIWGYDRADALDNVIFKRFRLFYKGIAATPDSARIDSLYLCQRTNPDLGSFWDDFVGCDSAISLGYVYNGHPVDNVYATYGLNPPAVGYDIIQGPIVPTGNLSDTAVFDFRKIAGARNLPLTSFIYFASGGLYSDPPFNYTGALEWNQMLRGYPPRPPGAPRFINPVTGQPTSYWLSGDPVAGTGWVDGIMEAPGDRRMLMPSGPFTLAVGDSQEIVVAAIGGLGTSNLNSITVLKNHTEDTRETYYSQLLAEAPAPPTNVRAYSDYTMSTSIALSWTRPTLMGGGEIGPYVVRIDRDSLLIVEASSAESTYTDIGLMGGTTYTYSFQTRLLSNNSLSFEVYASGIAGGARVPTAPSELSVRGTLATGYQLQWRNPSTQIDGAVLNDFAGIRVYRDGVLFTVLARSVADTGRVDSTLDVPSMGGHSYSVTAIDNEVPVYESSPSDVVFPIFELPFGDYFLSAGLPNPGVWNNTSTYVDVDTGGLNLPSSPFALNPNGSPVGNGDVAETRPIDLFGRENDGVMLTYYFQPKGIADPPEIADSLLVEFRNSLGQWRLVRGYPGLPPGAPTPDFQFEYIPLWSVYPGFGATFFHSGFQVRFRSIGEASPPSEPLDNWFVDDLFFGVPTNSPQMVVSPQVIVDTSVVGVVDSTSSFVISNTGSISAPLRFSVVQYPVNSWISALPESGNVLPGQAMAVRLHTDFSSLDTGVYVTSFVVSGNDSVNVSDTINVSFLVTLAPSATASPDSFHFALNGGDSVVSTIIIGNGGEGPLRYRTTVSGALAPENIGNGQTMYNPFPTQPVLGGVVHVARTSQLFEIRARLNISTPRDLVFSVYENTGATGVFTRIFEAQVSNAGPGLQFYSSGPVSVVLDSGLYYAVGVGASGTVGFFFQPTAPVPMPISFGTIVGGLRAGNTPTINVLFMSNLYQVQLITSENKWLSVSSGGVGTVFPGDSTELRFRVRTNNLPMGSTAGSLLIENNDPLNRTINVPITLDILTRLPELEDVIPQSFALFQNYPNPFNPSTAIRYELPRDSKVVLKIYNILGQEIAVLVNDEKKAGKYEVEYDGRGLASGVYFYRLQARQIDGGQAGEFVETKKLLLLK